MDNQKTSCATITLDDILERLSHEDREIVAARYKGYPFSILVKGRYLAQCAKELTQDLHNLTSCRLPHGGCYDQFILDFTHLLGITVIYTKPLLQVAFRRHAVNIIGYKGDLLVEDIARIIFVFNTALKYAIKAEMDAKQSAGITRDHFSVSTQAIDSVCYTLANQTYEDMQQRRAAASKEGFMKYILEDVDTFYYAHPWLAATQVDAFLTAIKHSFSDN